MALILAHKIYNAVNIEHLSREERQTPEVYRAVYQFVEHKWDFNKDYYEYFVSGKRADDSEYYESPEADPEIPFDDVLDHHIYDNDFDPDPENDDEIDQWLDELAKSVEEERKRIAKESKAIRKKNNQIRIDSTRKRYRNFDIQLNGAKMNVLQPKKRRKVVELCRRASAHGKQHILCAVICCGYFG